MSGTGPTLDLLLAAVAVDGRELDAASIRDWPGLIDAALKHRIVPLLVHRLRAADFASVPDEARAILESWEARFHGQSLRQTAELVALLRDLAEAGIDASPYKGPVLAEALYGSVALRSFYDLDVLVRASDRDAAAEVVRARGYLPDEAAAEHDHDDDCELHFRHPETDLLLELHWDVLPGRHLDDFSVDPLWERRVAAKLGGFAVRVLSPEDRMLVLCIHGGDKHRWMRLQMVADVARLMGEELDWGLVLRRAAEVGRTETVLVGATLAATALGAPFPAVLQDGAARPAVRAKVALALGRVDRRNQGLPPRARWEELLGVVDGALRDAGAPIGSRPGALRYWREVSRPEWTDRQAVHLPRGLTWLYYVVRPLRLLRMHGGGIFRRL